MSLKSLLSPCARHGYTFIYPHRVRGVQGLDESTRNIAGILLYTHKHRVIPHNIAGILLYTRNKTEYITHITAPTPSRVYFYVPMTKEDYTTPQNFLHDLAGILLYTSIHEEIM